MPKSPGVKIVEEKVCESCGKLPKDCKCVKHTVKGKKCSLDIKIPKRVDLKIRVIVYEILRNCLEKEHYVNVKQATDNLIERVDTLMKYLKEDKLYDKELEKGIREFMGIHLNHGFEIGCNYMKKEEKSKDIEEIISEQMDYMGLIEKLPEEKELIGVYLFYGLDLGRLAHETGLMMSVYLQEDKIDKYYKKLEREVRTYIR